MKTYKFRVLIDTATDGDIFRDILVAENDNYESFYNTILLAFNFVGDQLASFYLSNEDWDKGHEITLMDMGLGNALESPSIMKETPLNQFIHKEGQRAILVYDFMRMWCFLIELVEITDDLIDSPEVILQVGEAPLESSKEIDLSGGMPGEQEGLDLGNDIDDIFSDYDDDEFDDIDSLGDEY